MTAVYAFTSSSNRLACLLADDIEFSSKRRVDKVHLVDSRYAIAVIGVDTTEQALGIIGAFSERDGFEPHDSVGALATEVGKVLRVIAEALHPEYLDRVNRGEISRQAWQMVVRNSAGMIVLDRESGEMYGVELGPIFPPGPGLESPIITQLESDVLHRFALAAGVGPRASPLQPPPADLREELSRVLTNDRMKQPAIGGVGASALLHGDDFSLTTCLDGPIDFARQQFSKGRVYAFEMTVMDCSGNAPTVTDASGA